MELVENLDIEYYMRFINASAQLLQTLLWVTTKRSQITNLMRLIGFTTILI